MDNTKWVVINHTDGIMALPPTTKELAELFVKDFPNKFKSQGYYLSSDGERIKPEDVKLEIKIAE